MAEQKVWDAIVIGGGPTGLTAGLYLAREGRQVLVLEKEVPGGMVSKTFRIENYTGFADGIDGLSLASQMEQQAKNQGVTIGLAGVVSIRTDDQLGVELDDGRWLSAKALLIASGNQLRQLGIPGESELVGRKIHFCSTCDAAFYKDKELVVVGGGNSAAEESVYLAKFAKKITILVRTEIKASQALVDDLQPLIDSGQVEVKTFTQAEKFAETAGQRVLVTVSESERGSYELEVDGVFEFIGSLPNTAFLADSGVELADDGSVKIDDQYMTNLPGVFAAGDVRTGAIKQITTAVGDGTQAALAIGRFLGPLTN